MAIAQQTLAKQEWFKAAIDPSISLESRYQALRMMKSNKDRRSKCIIATKTKREKPIREYNEVLQMTKDEAAKKYRWLVKKRAYECWARSRKNGFDLNDLIQEGYIGFLKAFDTYIYKHIHFDIYASKYVYHSILHFIRRKAPMIWYPASEAHKYRLRLSRVVYLDRLRSRGDQSDDECVDWYETLAGSTLDDHSLIPYKDFIQSLTRYEQSVIRLLLQEFPQRIVALMIGSSKQAVNESVKSIRSKYVYYQKHKAFKPGRGMHLCQR